MVAVGWVCKPILVFYFAPNHPFGLGLRLGPCQTTQPSWSWGIFELGKKKKYVDLNFRSRILRLNTKQ